jgi:hypothetical protein
MLAALQQCLRAERRPRDMGLSSIPVDTGNCSRANARNGRSGSSRAPSTKRAPPSEGTSSRRTGALNGTRRRYAAAPCTAGKSGILFLRTRWKLCILVSRSCTDNGQGSGREFLDCARREILLDRGQTRCGIVSARTSYSFERRWTVVLIACLAVRSADYSHPWLFLDEATRLFLPR